VAATGRTYRVCIFFAPSNGKSPFGHTHTLLIRMQKTKVRDRTTRAHTYAYNVHILYTHTQAHAHKHTHTYMHIKHVCIFIHAHSNAFRQGPWRGQCKVDPRASDRCRARRWGERRSEAVAVAKGQASAVADGGSSVRRR